MESLRRFLNPLLLNLQKMELELTCAVCLKLLSAPTLLPCCHTSCRNCATTQTMNGYSCAICKLVYRSQDLRPASHLEAVVNIHRSISSTVSSMVTHQGSQVDIPAAKTTFQGTPESGNKNFYNSVASKPVHEQSTGPANANVGGIKARDPALGNKANDVSVEPTILVQKGPCGSQSSDGPRDLDCDSNDLEGELITSTPPQSVLKREPSVINDHTRELKRQKPIDQSEKQPTMAGAWKCEFCHTSKITECTGPLLHYLHGEPVKDDQAWKSNVLHVHEKCIEWAPQAFFTGDIVNNLEHELARASKIKCSLCGLKGAALGCLVKSCRKSFHVPCAHGISGCRWDEGNFVMLCPAHSSKRLPCERSKSKNKKAKLQRSSLDTMVGDLNSPSPMERNELWTGSPFLTSEWVICGSALSGQEKEILDQFEHQTGITVTNNWRSNVTHVVANTDEHGACARTLKVLMAILAGKWVLDVKWLRACMEAREPVPEEPFEISSDVHGSFCGPRTGRLRVMQKAPSLFAGLTFYFSGHFVPTCKANMEDLLAVAGGLILDKADLSSTSLIVYCMELPQGSDQDTLDLVINKRRADGEELAATIGCKQWEKHEMIVECIVNKARGKAEVTRLLLKQFTNNRKILMSKEYLHIFYFLTKPFIRSRSRILSSNSANAMAFFNSGSRALVEILTRLQSAERPMPVDHTFFEFGSIRYHVQASASDPENIHLSISTPSLSHEASPSTALPEFTVQETRKMYRKFAEIVEPTTEGYALTLKLNFSGLTRPKDRAKAINQISLLQSVILSSQLKDMLGKLGPSGTTKLVYNRSDPFFVSRMPGKINAIFPMRFKDDTDLAIAASFFQELQDVGSSFSRAPRCSWSPIPPPELRGEPVQHLTTNGGFVLFDILSRHVEGKRAAKTAWILLNFQSYVKYHIKCTRSHIQSRMRKRQDSLTEVIQNARLRGNDDKKKLQVRRKSKRRLISLAKAKKLHKGFRAIIDKIKRLRLRIRVKALDRFRRQCQCFAMPRRKERNYQKLE